VLLPTSKKLGFYSVFHFLTKKKKSSRGPKTQLSSSGNKNVNKKSKSSPGAGLVGTAG